MKNILLFLSLYFVGFTAVAQNLDSTGLEGDNLDLEAVLEVFKDSESPEDFEKKLNSEKTKVNNLDLDGDGNVDYIRVVESGDSTAHILTLQVPVTATEWQDIAVIEMEETENETVNLQIIGDEELYGENYILVPQDENNSAGMLNVYSWRPVNHMYSPKYVFWVSPWFYNHHPKWYKPWKRSHWGVYHSRVIHHHGHCNRVYTHNFTHAHSFYHHTHSPAFHEQHHYKHTSKAGKTEGLKSSASPAPKSKSNELERKKSAPAPQQVNDRKRPGAANDHQTSGTKTNSTKTAPRKNSPAKKGGRN